MKIDSLGRILGSFLIVTAYFIVLHISATLGALMHLIANIISVPFFIRTKAWDVVIMLSFLMVISLTKVL
jgi:Na+/H+ antiporter NhaD/arsenite permease-like protein